MTLKPACYSLRCAPISGAGRNMDFTLPDLIAVASRDDDSKDIDAALSAVEVVTLRHVIALCRTYVTQKQKITEIRKEISDLCSNGAGTKSRTRHQQSRKSLFWMGLACSS